ncbi:MAG: phage holin family protein [Patescibacteria group bacterium]
MVRILLALIGNTFALLLARAIVPGLTLSSNFFDVLIIALILTALNFFLKPVLKLIFGPIIVLTLGLGSLIVNMIIVYILDILSKGITIQGNLLLSLFLVAVIVGVVNIIIHWSKK